MYVENSKVHCEKEQCSKGHHFILGREGKAKREQAITRMKEGECERDESKREKSPTD